MTFNELRATVDRIATAVRTGEELTEAQQDEFVADAVHVGGEVLIGIYQELSKIAHELASANGWKRA